MQELGCWVPVTVLGGKPRLRGLPHLSTDASLPPPLTGAEPSGFDAGAGRARGADQPGEGRSLWVGLVGGWGAGAPGPKQAGCFSPFQATPPSLPPTPSLPRSWAACWPRAPRCATCRGSRAAATSSTWKEPAPTARPRRRCASACPSLRVPSPTSPTAAHEIGRGAWNAAGGIDGGGAPACLRIKPCPPSGLLPPPLPPCSTPPMALPRPPLRTCGGRWPRRRRPCPAR